jgi:hypothetical protein
MLKVDQYRVEETARWFALGFWGINSSTHVSFHGIAEGPGIRNFPFSKIRFLTKRIRGKKSKTVCQLSQF